MPMLDDVFDERDRLIQTNLEAAERINKQAELLIKEYDEFMLSADQRKAAMLKAVYEDMNRTTSKIEGEHDKLVRKQIQKTEDELHRLRSQLHAQSDNIATLVADKLAKKLGVGKTAKR